MRSHSCEHDCDQRLSNHDKHPHQYSQQRIPGAYNSLSACKRRHEQFSRHSVTLPFLRWPRTTASAIFRRRARPLAWGRSITYNLAVLPVGAAYNNAVTLSCHTSPAARSPKPAGSTLSPTLRPPVWHECDSHDADRNGRLLRPAAKANSWLFAVWLALPAVVVWVARQEAFECNPAASWDFALARVIPFALVAGAEAAHGEPPPGQCTGGHTSRKPQQINFAAHQPESANLVAVARYAHRYQ